MRRAFIIAAGLTAASAGAAMAAGGASKADESGQHVNISPVALPIVLNGRLLNYVFVTVRLDLATSANVTKLREKEPFFRDALVRAAHRTPFTLKSDLTKIDEPRLQAVMMREAQAIAGPGAVRAVVIVAQTPKNRRVVAPS